MSAAARISTTLRTLTIASIALVALAGCSGSTEPTQSAEAMDSLLPAAEGTTEYPLTLTTAVGEVVLEDRPERVVMASSWDADLFAALGVTPVGTDAQVEFYPWAQEKIPGQIETVWPVSDDAYPAEQVANTSPDLIVDTLASDAETVQQLSDISPVLGAPADNPDDPQWQERLLLLGEALDLSARAQQVIDDYDATFDDVRAEHPEFAGKTVDYLVFWGGGAGTGYLNIAGSDPEALLTRMGFAANSNADSFPDETISDELLDTLTGDVLVISNQASDQAEFDAWFANPLIARLPSVQNDQAIVLNLSPERTVTYNGELQEFTGHFGRAWNFGPLAHAEIADLLVPKLSDKLS